MTERAALSRPQPCRRCAGKVLTNGNLAGNVAALKQLKKLKDIADGRSVGARLILGEHEVASTSNVIVIAATTAQSDDRASVISLGAWSE